MNLGLLPVWQAAEGGLNMDPIRKWNHGVG